MKQDVGDGVLRKSTAYAMRNITLGQSNANTHCFPSSILKSNSRHACYRIRSMRLGNRSFTPGRPDKVLLPCVTQSLMHAAPCISQWHQDIVQGTSHKSCSFPTFRLESVHLVTCSRVRALSQARVYGFIHTWSY
jgi:hypothetical protein